MENTDGKYWEKIKRFAFLSGAFPLLALIAAILLQRSGFEHMVESYDEGMARVIQYVLFFMGVLAFFFCEGISDFLIDKLFVKDDKKMHDENLSSYFAYTFLMLWILNMISVSGFFGFLISGNITWLAVFVILNISLQFKYFPSKARFNHLLANMKEDKK